MEGGDGPSFSSRILGSSTVIIAYFGVLLVLVLLLVWQARSMGSKTENYVGAGTISPAYYYTSGATQRRLGQEFSSTDQGAYTTVHNDELKELFPNIVEKHPLMVESLMPDRDPGPQFWEISSQLDAYQNSQLPQMSSAAGSHPAKEYLADDSVASRVQDELLREQLYH